jgi:hypothetical protein
MHLTTTTALVLVLLFALAFSGALWTAWLRTPLTPRVVLSFLAFMALVAVDIALIINQQPS